MYALLQQTYRGPRLEPSPNRKAVVGLLIQRQQSAVVAEGALNEVLIWTSGPALPTSFKVRVECGQYLHCCTKVWHHQEAEVAGICSQLRAQEQRIHESHGSARLFAKICNYGVDIHILMHVTSTSWNDIEKDVPVCGRIGKAPKLSIEHPDRGNPTQRRTGEVTICLRATIAKVGRSSGIVAKLIMIGGCT